MKTALNHICIIVLVFIVPFESLAQENIYIEAGTAVSFQNYKADKIVGDFSYHSSPILSGYLNVGFRIKRLEIRLLAERQDWSRFSWEMEQCGCSNSYEVNRSARFGGAIYYFPEFGSRRFEPYGGLAVEKVALFRHGVIGSGHPFLFPTRENDYKVEASLPEDGGSAAIVFGVYYNLGKKFSVVLQGKYTAWLGAEPFEDWDIRFYSSNYAYDMRLLDTGRTFSLSTGIRLNVNGHNYRE